MRRHCLAGTAVLLFVSISAVVLAKDSKSSPPPPDRDPFVGIWRANGDKSQPKLNKVEGSYTRTVRRIGEDIVFSSAGGAAGAKIREHRFRCDGKFYPLPTGPVMSCRWLNSSSVEGETHLPDGRKDYWVTEVTPDGRMMTITAFKDKARTKIASIMILDRIE